MHRRCIHTQRGLYAVMGSWLAGKTVPEELGSLEAAGRQWDSHTSQPGRQGPRMLEAEKESRQREREIGRDTEAASALAAPAISQ